MRVLVTGGAGFIGSAVVRQALGAGHQVICLDALTYAAPEPPVVPASAPEYVFEKADICDPAALARVFESHDPEAVLHLAAETHVDRSIAGPAAFVRTNVTGTCTLLEAVHGHWQARGAPDTFRFIHVSTDEVFGTLPLTGGVPFTETTPYAPRSPYAASKAGADHLVRVWAETYGLPAIVTHCSNNFGPYQFPEKLIPVTILSALAGRPIPVYGTGANVRDWLFVEDHARALLAVLEAGAPGRSYVIGGEAEQSNLDLVRTLCRILDAEHPRGNGRPHGDLVTFVPDRPGHDLRYALDPSRIRSELGWSPRTDLTEGLRQTVRWYLDHPAWWQHPGRMPRGLADVAWS